MILPQLLWRFLRHRDDPVFYEIQATDAIRWLRANGVATGPGTTALDLGCGHGVFGGALAGLGCQVTFADASDQLLPAHRGATGWRRSAGTTSWSARTCWSILPGRNGCCIPPTRCSPTAA